LLRHGDILRDHTETADRSNLSGQASTRRRALCFGPTAASDSTSSAPTRSTEDDRCLTLDGKHPPRPSRPGHAFVPALTFSICRRCHAEQRPECSPLAESTQQVREASRGFAQQMGKRNTRGTKGTQKAQIKHDHG